MLALTFALATAAHTVIDADIAFADAARTRGQWTAFRAYAAPDAKFYSPEPSNALDDLKDAKDPPKSAIWWPTAAWQSCDGTLGVTTGDASWPDGHTSRYTTIWQRQTDRSWKWIYDNGETVPSLAPKTRPTLITASCKGHADPLKTTRRRGVKQGVGSSADQSLAYHWDATHGRHRLFVHLWNGAERSIVHHREIAA